MILSSNINLFWQGPWHKTLTCTDIQPPVLQFTNKYKDLQIQDLTSKTSDSHFIFVAFLLPYLENSYSSIETHCKCDLLCEVLGLTRWLSTKESACNARDTGNVGSIPGWGRSPGGGNSNPLTVFLPGKSHGQRSLMGYSPRGHEELTWLRGWALWNVTMSKFLLL